MSDPYGGQILAQLHTLTRVIGGLETEVQAQRRESAVARQESSDRLAAVREEISSIREITDRLDTDVLELRKMVGKCPAHDSSSALVQIRAPKKRNLRRIIGAILTTIGAWWTTHTHRTEP